MAHSDGLTVRRHKRHDVALDGVVSLAPEHAGAVRFKPPPGSPEGSAPALLVDIGEGGFGFVTSVYLPRRAHIQLRVPDPGNPGGEPLLDARGVVQRVTMTDKGPAYLVGAAFASDVGVRETVDRVLRALGASGGMGEAGSGGVESAVA